MESYSEWISLSLGSPVSTNIINITPTSLIHHFKSEPMMQTCLKIMSFICFPRKTINYTWGSMDQLVWYNITILEVYLPSTTMTKSAIIKVHCKLYIMHLNLKKITRIIPCYSSLTKMLEYMIDNSKNLKNNMIMLMISQHIRMITSLLRPIQVQ